MPHSSHRKFDVFENQIKTNFFCFIFNPICLQLFIFLNIEYISSEFLILFYKVVFSDKKEHIIPLYICTLTTVHLRAHFMNKIDIITIIVLFVHFILLV